MPEAASVDGHIDDRAGAWGGVVVTSQQDRHASQVLGDAAVVNVRGDVGQPGIGVRRLR